MFYSKTTTTPVPNTQLSIAEMEADLLTRLHDERDALERVRQIPIHSDNRFDIERVLGAPAPLSERTRTLLSEILARETLRKES